MAMYWANLVRLYRNKIWVGNTEIKYILLNRSQHYWKRRKNTSLYCYFQVSKTSRSNRNYIYLLWYIKANKIVLNLRCKLSCYTSQSNPWAGTQYPVLVPKFQERSFRASVGLKEVPFPPMNKNNVKLQNYKEQVTFLNILPKKLRWVEAEAPIIHRYDPD